jgi:hypothetical protein
VGRQPVTWGEGRLLGAADASPTGRSLDGVRGRVALGDGAVELLGAALEDWPSVGGFSVSPYGELFGARGEWAFDPLFALEGYVLVRLARANPTLQSAVKGPTYTGAARFHGDGRAWTWGVEGAAQWGRVDGAPRAGFDDFTGQRAAWAVAGHVAHAFEGTYATPTIRLGAAYATGDDSGSKYRAFDPLLPDVRTWHGALDAFAWSNEAEANARVSIATWADGLAAVEYRYARLAQPGSPWQSGYLRSIGQVAGNTHPELGHEIDAVLQWSPWTSVRLEAAYSALVLADGAKALLAATYGSTARVAHSAYGEARVDF